MARARHRFTFSLLLLLAVPARPARADTAGDLAQWLDADAPVAFRVDATEIEEGVDFYRRSGLPGAVQTVFVTSAASTALLGFDVLTARSWQSAGFDSTAPILGTIAAIDSAAVERIIARDGKGAEHLYWRSRLALRTSDRKRAEATLRKLARLAPGASEITAANTALVAGVLGAPAARGPAIVRALKQHNAIVAARDPLFGQLIFVHMQGDVVIVDLLAPFDGSSLDWQRDRKALLAALARKPGKRSLAARLGKGAARRLAEPGTVLWVQPEKLLAALRAHEQAELLRASPNRHIDPANLPWRDPLCIDLGRALASGAFTDMAIVTRLKSATGRGPRSLESRVEWGLRPGLSLAAALLAEDDRLIDAGWQVDKHGAVAAGAIFLRSFDALRTLPRPKLMQGNMASTLRSLHRCGAHRAAALALFAWPQLAGQLLDEIAAIHPQARTLVGSARNAAFAIQRASARRRDLVAAVEQSFAEPADDLLARYFADLFGAKADHATSGRRYRTWGRGPIRPYRREVASRPIFGFGLNPKAVTWYLASPPPKHKQPAGSFADFHLRPPELFAQLAQDGSGVIAGAAAALRPLVAHFPRAHGTVGLDGDVLRAALVWQLK